MWLVGYTPQGLHKLSKHQKCRLWKLGFNHVPDTKDEFWVYHEGKALIARHHTAPRRAVYQPQVHTILPFPVSWLGPVSHCTKTYRNRQVSQGILWWRTASRATGGALWTGQRRCTALGGDLKNFQQLHHSDCYRHACQVCKVPQVARRKVPNVPRCKVPQVARRKVPKVPRCKVPQAARRKAKGSEVQGATGCQAQGAEGSVQGTTGCKAQGAKGSEVQGATGLKAQGAEGSEVQGASGLKVQGAFQGARRHRF